MLGYSIKYKISDLALDVNGRTANVNELNPGNFNNIPHLIFVTGKM